MKLVDTHTHLYLNTFDDDRAATIQRAVEAGVNRMLLPNIDSTSVGAMHQLVQDFPEHCFPMIGLHPTSVKENWEEELRIMRSYLDAASYVAIGEIGIDLYWDQSFRKEQEAAFRIQLGWASEKNLPVSIHCRESMDVVIDILEDIELDGLTGIFHCFSGDKEQAKRIIDLGFLLGIGGVLSFKNSTLCEVLQSISPEYMVLETDAPFLAPMPFRGKRNESAYIKLIANRLADCLGETPESIAAFTTRNAEKVFNLK